MSKQGWRAEGVPFRGGEGYLKYRYRDHEMVSAENFAGELILEHSERGLSAATIWWTCADNGHKYPMFLTDFVALAQESSVKFGIAKGEWKFVKRGANYGIALT